MSLSSFILFINNVLEGFYYSTDYIRKKLRFLGEYCIAVSEDLEFFNKSSPTNTQQIVQQQIIQQQIIQQQIIQQQSLEQQSLEQQDTPVRICFRLNDSNPISEYVDAENIQNDLESSATLRRSRLLI